MQNIEEKINKLSKEVFLDLNKQKSSYIDTSFYSNKLLDWSLRDEEIKLNLFRFTDVLPSLKSDISVINHAKQYFDHVSERLPKLFSMAITAGVNPLTASLSAPIIRKNISTIASRFIVGSDIHNALPKLKQIRKNNMAFTVDLLGEATLSETEALSYLDQYLTLIDTLSEQTTKWSQKPIIKDHWGEECIANISIKLSSLYSKVKPINTTLATNILSERLHKIFLRAKEKNVFVFVDMEDTSMVDITLNVLKQTLQHEQLISFDKVGIVIQAYLRRSEKDIQELLKWLKTKKRKLAIRLVKGAYWDVETIKAKQKNWPIPVWQKKSSSDANYEKLTKLILENIDHFYPAFGSHNIRSFSAVLVIAESLGIDNKMFELQTLYGMGDGIKKIFSQKGCLLREYAPIGELIPGMSYFVRRLLENTANESFLKQSYWDEENVDTLVAKPNFDKDEEALKISHTIKKYSFSNFPPLDFSIEKNRTEIKNEIKRQKERLTAPAQIVCPIINGERIQTLNPFSSYLADNYKKELASINPTTDILGNQAVESLSEYFKIWSNLKIEERTNILKKTAKIIAEKRIELIALISLEVGKTWEEADGEVCEAIDFLNYYSFIATKKLNPSLTVDVSGERNLISYKGRGITCVISPWNFPLAISCGMISAALVCGNTVCYKPSEQSSLIAERLVEIFYKAGLPKEALAFLPGRGESIGRQLVSDPRIDTIVFTGSMEVGLEIIENSHLVTRKNNIQRKHIPRVIAELGGKNFIIVDESADLDEAIKGVVESAFGYSGQKCSACSRVIVLAPIYDEFKKRISQVIESLKVGLAEDPSTEISPVIDKESFDRINNTIESATNYAKLIAVGKLPKEEANAFLIPAHLFEEIPLDSELCTKEIFGPVLGLYKADNFEDALNLANNTSFGLTGGVYSRTPKHLEESFSRLNVGNLYINRNCTGAIVNRQPFGAANMSGVGSKAGGTDYILQFCNPIVVSENTIRKGFAPS